MLTQLAAGDVLFAEVLLLPNGKSKGLDVGPEVLTR